MHSSRLSRAILQQTGGHPALPEAAPKARLRLAGDREQNDPLPFECEVDGRSRMEPDPVPQILWDHDLALRADAVNHTLQV
jgi:hypothetical protein